MTKTKTIAFLNGKGGCGKTTSLYHCAGVWAQRGKKVLIIDCDRQRNATRTFLMNTPGEPDATVYDALVNNLEASILEKAVMPAMFQTHGNAAPKYYGVDVIPGDARMSDTITLCGIGSEELRQNYEAFLTERGYDMVLIDMPPSVGEINRICLGYLTDYVISPFSSDFFSMTGCADILDAIETARETNPDLEMLGVFLARYMGWCCVDRYIREQLLKSDFFIDIQIPLSADLREAVMFGRPISFYRKESNSRRAYETLVNKIESMTDREREW